MVVSKQSKQVVVLYISTLCGMVLGMLCSIVNTRFLPPSEYGDVRYVQNIINFISAFLLFGYFLSGSRLMALSADLIHIRRIKGVMAIILLCAFFFLAVSMPICYLLHSETPTTAYLFLLSIPVCGYPLLLNYIEQTTQGDNQMGRLSMARLLPFLCYVLIAYLFYSIWGATSGKMILLQWGIYTIIYIVIIISTRPLFNHLRPIWKDIQEENKKYGIQLYIGSLVMVATNYIAGITLGVFNSDNSEVGFFTLALTIINPLIALPTIVGTAFFRKFASLPCIPKKVILYTVLLTMVSNIIFLLLIHPIVAFLYPPSYSIVATYGSLLSIGACIHGLGDMFNRYLCSQGLGVYVRNASIANGIVKILGYTVLVYLWNTNGAIATTIICDIIYAFCIIYYYHKSTKDGCS